MPFLSKPKQVVWTAHARAKMQFYKLSSQRVHHVLHSPKRIEEGVAPKTIAMMQPVQSHEIWVMFQDSPQERKIISAWRYPGVTKPRSEIMKKIMRQEYGDFLSEK